MARRVFATRVPTLALLIMGQERLMGSRVHLGAAEPLAIEVWCHDPLASQGRARLELWSNGGTRLATSKRVACNSSAGG